MFDVANTFFGQTILKNSILLRATLIVLPVDGIQYVVNKGTVRVANVLAKNKVDAGEIVALTTSTSTLIFLREILIIPGGRRPLLQQAQKHSGPSKIWNEPLPCICG